MWIGAPHPKSSLCHVWCFKVLWKSKYNISILSCDIMWPRDQKTCLGKKNSPSLSYHLAKFDAYRSCGSRDITFSFCHVTAYDRMISEKCDMIKGSQFWQHLTPWSTRNVVWQKGAPRPKVFILFCDITWLYDQRYIWLGK